MITMQTSRLSPNKKRCDRLCQWFALPWNPFWLLIQEQPVGKNKKSRPVSLECSENKIHDLKICWWCWWWRSTGNSSSWQDEISFKWKGLWSPRDFLFLERSCAHTESRVQQFAIINSSLLINWVTNCSIRYEIRTIKRDIFACKAGLNFSERFRLFKGLGSSHGISIKNPPLFFAVLDNYHVIFIYSKKQSPPLAKTAFVMLLFSPSMIANNMSWSISTCAVRRRRCSAIKMLRYLHCKPI